MQILYEINKMRFVTMEQFRMISGYGKSYTFEKSREYQRLGVMTKKELKGSKYYINKQRQGVYMKLTQKGMNHIRKHGYEVISTAQANNAIKHERIVSILKTNDLALELVNYGWEFYDGRVAKKLYKNTIRNAILHGLFNSPGQQREYGFYMLISEDNEKTIDIIKQQTPDIAQLTNYMIATRTSSAVRSTIKNLDAPTVKIYGQNINKLQVGGKLRVMPIGFAQIYLPISNDVKEKHKQFIEMLGFQVLVDMDNKKIVQQHNLSRRRFDYVVRYSDYAEHKGEDFYLVDMLDNDLTKLREIAEYSESEYESDTRKVIVLTTNQACHKPIHELYLLGKHFIFHPIKLKYVQKIKNHLYPDVVVPDRSLKK